MRTESRSGLGHAIVTGGNRGIGAAIASALARAGATVTIMGRDAAKLNETAHEIAQQSGAPVTIIQCDVTDERSVTEAFKAALDAHGTPYILVNNAGQADSAPLSETTLELWNRMLAVNLTGTFLCTKQVIGAMTAAGSGRIVNIASTAGLKGAARISAYCASKHGVIGFTRALAAETARTGVTVNAVCPSYTESEMTERTLAAVAERRATTRAGALELIERTVPIGRLIKPDEVAAAVLYLCSAEAAAITGHALAVDGGETQ
ncbi:MAG: SDR family NAD(P)-dependent oxidoreductase [Gemmatimonadota bacterium]